MTSIPVYVGRWHDYSQSSIFGEVVTLNVRWGGYLIAALSTFVGFVGTALWSLLAFTIHQCRAQSDRADGVYFQQQVIYRNPGSPLTAVLDILRICYFWRKTGSSARVQRLKIRSLLLSLPPLVIFTAFVAAGIFVSEVAGKSYRSNDVLVKAGICGNWEYYENSTERIRAEQLKIVNDTLAAKSYVAGCYGSGITFAECSLYPMQELHYDVSAVPCPFGHDPKGENVCLFGQNNAFQLDTNLMDTSDLLGINAPPENRLRIRKRLTCSPLNTVDYVSVSNLTDPLYTYYLGRVVGEYNSTFEYLDSSQFARGGYQIFSLFAQEGLWDPVQALQVPNGDVTIHFLTPYNVKYLTPVDDIWFAAHVPDQLSTSPAEIDTVYGPDQLVSVMGCVDQYQICNPNTNPYTCTIISKFSDVTAGFLEIRLNNYQLATAYRLADVIEHTNTYFAVTFQGDDALLARNRLVQFIGSGLPANQWQIEVQGWFETSLAKIQSYVVQYAANVADLGPYGYVASSNPDGDPVERAGASFCSEQRIRNTGAYQTFSFFGLMIVACIGSVILITSWTAETIVCCIRRNSKSQKHDYREIARVADQQLQLQRVALRGSGYEEGWVNLLDVVPVIEGGKDFSLPIRIGEDDYQYPCEKSSPSRISSPVSQSDVAQSSGGIPPEHSLEQVVSSHSGPSLTPTVQDAHAGLDGDLYDQEAAHTGSSSNLQDREAAQAGSTADSRDQEAAHAGSSVDSHDFEAAQAESSRYAQDLEATHARSSGNSPDLEVALAGWSRYSQGMEART